MSTKWPDSLFAYEWWHCNVVNTVLMAKEGISNSALYYCHLGWLMFKYYCCCVVCLHICLHLVGKKQCLFLLFHFTLRAS